MYRCWMPLPTWFIATKSDWKGLNHCPQVSLNSYEVGHCVWINILNEWWTSCYAFGCITGVISLQNVLVDGMPCHVGDPCPIIGSCASESGSHSKFSTKSARMINTSNTCSEPPKAKTQPWARYRCIRWHFSRRAVQRGRHCCFTMKEHKLQETGPRLPHMCNQWRVSEWKAGWTFDEAACPCWSKRQCLVCCVYRRGWPAQNWECLLSKNMVSSAGRMVSRICLCKRFTSQYKQISISWGCELPVLLLYGMLWFWFPLCSSLLSVPCLHHACEEFFRRLCHFVLFASRCWSSFLSLLVCVLAAEKTTFRRVFRMSHC